MEPGTQRGADLSSCEDAELVRQIAAAPPGHAPEAEAEIYRRMAPRVRLYGIRHLRDEHAAADLMQEVLLIVLGTLREGRLRDPGKFVSFVLGTCRMVVLNMRRGTFRRQELLDRFRSDLPVASYAPAPEIDRLRLRQCLQSLSERERSVVLMSYFDEQSAEEVSSFLSISQANVRIIRHRALRDLRTCMSGGRTAS
jgi:RNA polymerase sigma-70 factor (ECF subfamily)